LRIYRSKARRRKLKGSLVASLNNNGIFFTKPNGKIFWCNDAILPIQAIAKKKIIEKTPVQIGRTLDIDDEQLDIMVSSFIMDSL
jgi:hypothetical protein